MPARLVMHPSLVTLTAHYIIYLNRIGYKLPLVTPFLRPISIRNLVRVTKHVWAIKRLSPFPSPSYLGALSPKKSVPPTLVYHLLREDEFIEQDEDPLRKSDRKAVNAVNEHEEKYRG
ncbi:unnamed protein product [Mesocestoides corti]|uniref:28S ribosomal protein S36, mitochondrial n=1 Tax=Mesocestoides corti TaxID=53468 RepID=A0A0R3UG37_MESCO|nr:unnamed protein product [Mesocestoides corti]